MDDIIIAVIQLVIAIVAFLLGKYVFPNIKKLSDTDNDFIAALSTWVYNFVIDAKNSFHSESGSEKRTRVYRNVRELLDKWGVDLTDEQIYGLIESAYDKMLVEAPIKAEYNAFEDLDEDIDYDEIDE